MLARQLFQHLVEQVQGPGSIEEAFRSRRVGRFAEVAVLGVVGVDGQRGPAATALEGTAPFVVMGQEEAAVGPQEGAEAAPTTVGRGQDIGLQESREVLLGQVERLVGVMPLAANERIDRIPVGPAQLGQGLAGRGLGAVASGDDATPSGRREPVVQGRVGN
jgi:hypothetical protein